MRQSEEINDLPALRFQFTHPRRVRRAKAVEEAGKAMFQFTHPRRVRRSWIYQAEQKGIGFNSRTRVGCDPVLPSIRLLFCGFNSRTRVGCDQYLTDEQAAILVSIHAPA